MRHSNDRNITFAMIKPCKKALQGLSKQKPSPILAEIDAFAEQWTKGTPLEVIKGRYDFKPVSIGDRCKRRGNVFQIRLRGNQYRALMAFVDAARTCYWLDIFVKNPTDQDNHIRTACGRALRLQEIHENDESSRNPR